MKPGESRELGHGLGDQVSPPWRELARRLLETYHEHAMQRCCAGEKIFDLLAVTLEQEAFKLVELRGGSTVPCRLEAVEERQALGFRATDAAIADHEGRVSLLEAERAVATRELADHEIRLRRLEVVRREEPGRR